MKEINPRELAYEIIYQVKYQKGYSNIVINKFFRENKPQNQDRGFITELVYGVLSKLYLLDYIIAKHSSIRLSKLSKQTRTILQMSLYQMMYMDSTTDYGVVDQGVMLVKAKDNRGTGYANALLRSLAKNNQEDGFQKLLTFEDIKDKVEKLSVAYSVSPYIAGRFLKQYGEEFARELLQGLAEKPPLIIRVNSLKYTIPQLEKALTSSGVELQPQSLIPGVFSATGMKSIGENSLFREGAFVIQDTSSMQAVMELNPQPGETVLDLCAAPGGKSFFIAQLMNNQGRVHAMDISENKLALLNDRAMELGIQIITTEPMDGEILVENMLNQYDRVLVDAPCSGYGIIRRKPEIRYKTYEDVNQLPQIQQRLLSNGGKYVKPGGRLVYSTCTLEQKENSGVVEAFLQENPDFTLLKPMQELYPQVDHTDGFFIAVMEKR